MTIGGKEYSEIIITDENDGWFTSITDGDIIADGNCKVKRVPAKKKKELPKSINILGINYEVEERDVIDKYEPVYGQIEYSSQVIKIDSSLSEQKKGVVFIHEVLHGVLEGLGMSDFNENESAVQSLATALYCVLRPFISFF